MFTFAQLLEELRKVREEMAQKLNGNKELKAEIERLQKQVEDLLQQILVLEKEKEEHICKAECDHTAYEQEVAELQAEIEQLKKSIAEHVCPTCNHEEEIEVLNQELASIKAENNQLKAEHEENVKALQAEIEQLKKILATS